MNTLITLATIWLPGPLTFLLYDQLSIRMPDYTQDWTPTDQAWRHELHLSRHYPGAAMPTLIMKDEVETPRAWMYIVLLIFCLGAIARSQKNMGRLKEMVFWVIFAVLMVVRCLGSFSGTLHITTNHLGLLFPTNATSVFKGLFIQWVLSLQMWDRISFAGYEDIVALPTTDSDWRDDELQDPITDDVDYVHDRKPSGKKLTLLTHFCISLHSPLLSGHPSASHPSSPELDVSWHTNLIRLSYYHVIDSTLHVLCVRYCWASGQGAPYTDYVNNEEILTVLLAVLMAIWRVVKMRLQSEKETGAEVDDEQRGTVVDEEKVEAP
jgi:hypothetical protein